MDSNLILLAGSSKGPAAKHQKRSPGTKLADFKHVHQFVEITTTHKNQLLLEILRHLMAHHLRFPSFKMIVYACKTSIHQLMQQISESLGPLLSLTVMKDELPVDQQIALLQTDFHSGVLLVNKLNLPVEYFPNVNFIVNYNLPASVASLSNTYLRRLKQLTLNQSDTFVINFFNEFNYPLTVELILLLKKMKQPVNPLLYAIQKKIVANTPAAVILNYTRNYVATEPTGNLQAFFHMTSIAPLVKKIQGSPVLVPVIPSVSVGDTPPMEFEPGQVAFDDAKTTYFFEILSEDQKFGALKKVLESVSGNLNYGRFRMVIVATAQSTRLLETQLLQHFHQLPVKRSGCQSQFQHGVLLYELSESLLQRAKAIPAIDILLIYDYWPQTQLENVLQIATARTEKRYAITFIGPDSKLNAKMLLSHLRDNKKTMAATEASTLQKILDALLEPDLIGGGNLAAFARLMTSEKLHIGENVAQFVEVLSTEDKPGAVLELIQTVFAEATALESYRMLVFVAGVSLPAVEGFLRMGLQNWSVPLLAIASDSPDFRTVVTSFQSGVLLVAEQSFHTNHQRFGIDPVNFVVNYDYEYGCSHFEYLNRLSKMTSQPPVAAVTFITRQNLDFVEQLVKVLQASKQAVNPVLHQIIADPDSKKTFSLLKANTERLIIDTGNLKAFTEYLQTQSPAQLPIATTITTPKSNVISVAAQTSCLQFAENLPADQKLAALLDLIKHAMKYFPADRLKILVFIRGLVKERVQNLDVYLRDGLTGVPKKFENLCRLYGHCQDPPSVIQYNFKMFIEMPNTILCTDVDSRFLGFNKSDFVIFYESPNDWDIYLDAVDRFRPANSSVFYLLTFLPDTDHQLAKRLTKMGNMAELRNALRAPVIVTANRLQFVEVMPVDQKQFMLLHLTQSILETWTYGRLKIMVFVRGLVPEKVKQLEHLLQADVVGCSRYFVPCKGDVATIQQTIRKFEGAESGMLVTDIDSRYVGVDAADFVLFYDSPSTLEVYLDALSRFQPVNSSHIYFATFVAIEDSALPPDLVQVFGKINKEILPKTTNNVDTIKETKNVAALLAHLAKTLPPTTGGVETVSLSGQQLQITPQSLKPKNECLQYVEVLTIDEKIDKLLDLFNYMGTLQQYKQLKIVIFVRGLTKERTAQFDNLLNSDLKLMRRRYSYCDRFYAYVQCPFDEIQQNLKAFADCTNGVLITDVDSRYLGVNTADFLVFYDSPSSSEVYMDALSRFFSENSSHTSFVTFLLASDCNLTKALPGILNEFNHPVNPLIYKLIDRVKNPITDSAIREIRKTIKIGNLYALFKSDQCPTLPVPYTSFTQLMRKFPACMINWLIEASGNRPGPIQSHVWPVMFSKMDLLAIAPNSEERIITFVLAAITWIMNEYDQVQVTEDGVPHPIVVIFAPSEDSVKQIQALIKVLGYLMASAGHEVYLTELILVEQPVTIFQTKSDGHKHYFGNCKYVIFDEFDKMMALGYIEEVANVLLTIRDEKMFDGDVCLSIFSSVFSVFEKLVSLEFLENYHYFNFADVTGQAVAESRWMQKFTSVGQYVEVAEFSRRRMKSLCGLLKRILASAANNERFAIIVFLANRNDDEYMFAVYNKLLSELPRIAKQIFYNKRDFTDETERDVFWHHFKAQHNQIYLTNDSRVTQRVQHVKYVINFDFPTGHLSSFEYLQLMTTISCKNASVISFFGLDDFKHSDVFVELLIHMKQKVNPLLYEMKIVTELENTTHDMFNDELKRAISNSTNDLMEFVTKLERTKCHSHEEGAEQASTSRGASSKRFKKAE